MARPAGGVHRGPRGARTALYDELGDQRRAGQCAVWLWEHHAIYARPAIASGWLRRARRALDGRHRVRGARQPAAPRGRDGPRRRRARRGARSSPRRPSSSGGGCGRPTSRPRRCRRKGRDPHRPGPARRRDGPPRRGDALRRRGSAPAVLDRQGVLQPHRRLRGGRRLRPSRRVDRGDHAVGGGEPPVRDLARHLPRAPGRGAQATGRARRGRGGGRARVRGAPAEPRRQQRGRLRRGGRHPPPPRRPRRRRGGVRPVAGDQRRAVRRSGPPAPRAGTRRRGACRSSPAASRRSRTALARAGLLPMLVHVAVAADGLDVARDALAELEAIVEAFDTPTLRATELSTRGRLQLAARTSRRRSRRCARGGELARRSTSPTRRPRRGRCSARRSATAATTAGATESFEAAAAALRPDRRAARRPARVRRHQAGAPRRAHRARGRGAPADRRRPHQQRDRRRAVPEHQDRVPPPVQHLHEDRRVVPSRRHGLRLRAPPRGGRARPTIPACSSQFTCIG